MYRYYLEGDMNTGEVNGEVEPANLALRRVTALLTESIYKPLYLFKLSI